MLCDIERKKEDCHREDFCTRKFVLAISNDMGDPGLDNALDCFVILLADSQRQEIIYFVNK